MRYLLRAVVFGLCRQLSITITHNLGWLKENKVDNTKHTRVAKGIETAANIGIVIVALLAAVFMAKSHFASSVQPRQPIPIGSKIEVKDITWTASRATLVLALSTTCRFCTESAPFYRELTKYAKERNIRTIAILPQPLNEASTYLSNENVRVDEIRQNELSAVHVTGTPTLLLIDSKGTVQGSWIGKLPEQSEKDVLAKLGS